MDIVFVADTNYAMQTSVTIMSLAVSNPYYTNRIFLLSNGMFAEDINKIKNLCVSFGMSLIYIQIDERDLDMYDRIGEWSKYTFIKILIPKYLPEDVNTVLYLDSDMLVVGELSNLSCTSAALAAVEDIPAMDRHKIRCGLPKQAQYINSGIMLINLSKWRDAMRKGLFEEHLKRMKSRMESINDQDLINTVFCGDIECLPYEYNVTNAFWGIILPMLPKYKDIWRQARKNPIVIHFTNWRKPWIPEVCHPYKKAYIKCLKQTPYSEITRTMKVSHIMGYAKNYVSNLACCIIDCIRFVS